jgi:hypothetical protein
MPEPSGRGQVLQIDVKWNVADFGELTREAVAATAKSIINKGREDMLRGGKFGRFQKGLTSRTTKIQAGYQIRIFQKPGFLKGFEYGMSSQGKPLLWIPVPGLESIHGMKAKKFPGKLIRPRGKNVLIGARDRKVRYIGVRNVTNRRRTHIKEIAFDEAEKLTQQIGAAAKGAAAKA